MQADAFRNTAKALREKIITRAESFSGIKAGITRLDTVLNSPSYQAIPEITSPENPDAAWPPDAQTVIVLGLHHPDDNPHLDWWGRGNTAGNRRLIEISLMLKQWFGEEYRIVAHPLPYSVEQGGLFLKDAAVAAGLGIIGRNNLLIHPQWGTRIRLRAILINAEPANSAPLEAFAPCETCPQPCHAACPQQAFSTGVYSRSECTIQMTADERHKEPGKDTDEQGKPFPVVKYCRACEFACPVGQ
jgi:epoxyqueuosine reductase